MKPVEILILVGAAIFIGSIAVAVDNWNIRVGMLGLCIMFGGIIYSLYYTDD